MSHLHSYNRKFAPRRLFACGLFVTFLVNSAGAQVVEKYPIPISEYAEQTGTNTITFLSYPKYYQTDQGDLRETVTTLVPSSDPDWDFEVATGIWTLKVSTDGAFQANHEGDIFTYRLNSLGYGRGSDFRPLPLGELNWRDYQVAGDTIRWREVLPGIDLSVRYIHHILKVDVILKRDFMRYLRAVVKEGAVDSNGDLTVRFDIPQTLITTEARQNGLSRDLYSEPISLDSPLEFVKDGKLVHKLRVVETYPIDENGDRVFDNDSVIRSSQWWQLRADQTGIAEMSAHIGDLVKAPDGDVVIDPSSYFTTYGPASVNTMDAELAYNSSSNLGGNSTMPIGLNDNAVFACDFSGLGYNKAVTNMRLKIYVQSYTMTGMAQVRLYNVKEAWNESTVDWYEKSAGNYWDTSGGTYSMDNPGSVTNIVYAGWVYIDLTRPFNAWYSDFSEIGANGFLLNVESGSGSGDITFLTKEFANPNYVWSIEVTYYVDARAQSVWHRPFLKQRDGDIHTVNDRWFPIGWYLSIDDDIYRTWSYEDGNVTNLADGYIDDASQTYTDTYIYNAFKLKPWVDQRNKYHYADVLGCGKPSTQFPLNYSEIDDYQDFLDIMDDVYNTNYADEIQRNYYLLPAVVFTLSRAETSYGWLFGDTIFFDCNSNYDISIFSGVSYATSEISCDGFGFEWDKEYNAVENLVYQTKNYPANNPRVRGWNLDEESFHGMADNEYRDHMRSRISAYQSVILATDAASPGKYPIYTVETHDNFYDSYTFDGTEGETIVKAADVKIADMQYFDYILEDFSYYYDIYSERADDDWADAVYMVECAMRHTDLGYCRLINARNYGVYTPTHVGNGSNQDKYRFLPYASWAVGGQGLIIWDLPNLETPGWFKYCHKIAREAYAMREYLMNEPALDVPAIIYDSDGSTNHSLRTRFTLRRNQQNPTNQLLLLFCNFADDGESHSTYIHFPDDTVASVSRVPQTPEYWNLPQIIDDGSSGN